MRTYITQEELADRAELHRTEIGLLERGLRVPRIDTLLRLAAALAVEPAELLVGVHLQRPEELRMGVEALSPRERDETVEASLLAIAFDLHPEHLSANDLIRRAMAADAQSVQAQVLERALERLKDAQLLQELDRRISPTRAALRFRRLPI
jgi:transcriptional regulator with XRE-family HTH domain